MSRLVRFRSLQRAICQNRIAGDSLVQQRAAIAAAARGLSQRLFGEDREFRSNDKKNYQRKMTFEEPTTDVDRYINAAVKNGNRAA